jgi:uncharacterized protein YecT (DUF1311 family)
MKPFLLLILLATLTLAQTTPAELKKAKAEYAKADAALNAAYKEAMETLEKEEQASLRKDQREWIEYRDYVAKAQPGQADDDPEKPEASAVYWEMMAGLSSDRAEWLSSFTKDLPEGLTGEWMDSRGGQISLQERKDGVAFGIAVVRGHSFHVGGIAGLAKKTKTGAKFVEKVPKDEEREAAILTFTLKDSGWLEVKGEHTEHHHGARAYFDGEYRKVAKLAKPVSTTKAPNDEDEEEKK